MRRFAFLPVFLLLLPSVLTLAAPTPANPAPAAKTQAAAPAKPAVSAAKQAPAPAKTTAPAATAPAPVKPVAAPAKPAAAKPAAAVQPVYPEVLFRPLLRAKQSPNNFADPARAAELFLAREKLIQNLLLERRRILTADPKAREIHAKIMELNKQLAVVLESKRSVRELSRDLMLIDARIDALERKKPTPPAAAPAAQPPAPAQPAPAAAAKPQAAPQVPAPAPAAPAKPQAPASK